MIKPDSCLRYTPCLLTIVGGPDFWSFTNHPFLPAMAPPRSAAFGDFLQQIWQLKSGLVGQSKQPPLKKIGHYLTLHRIMLYMVLQIRVYHILFRVVQSDKIEVFTIIETPEMKPVLLLLRLVESVATPEKVRPKTWQFSRWGWCIVPNRGFPEKGGTPIAGWFINGKSHLEMDDLGAYHGIPVYTLFWETSLQFDGLPTKSGDCP